ncbi:MAG TPA: hypothetical protein VFA39_14745 [Steroidobacteraceae bacterium]|nr:hypothetical protein [Steroidobacteraceae bacterium]
MAERQAVARLTDLIRQLVPIDRQVILSYLEGMSAEEISELRVYRRRMLQPRSTGSRKYFADVLK